MGEAMRKQALLAAAESEMKAWGERPLVIEVDIAGALVFCGAMQLALRHPGFAARPSSKLCREIVMELADQVPEDFPALRELIRLGFHQRFDG
jgi:hypothetical protein